MSGPEAAFGGAAAPALIAPAETVDDHVFAQVVRRNFVSALFLQEFEHDRPLDIVDAGGHPSYTEWLARRGHSVTILAPTEEQREAVHASIMSAPYETASQVRVVHGTSEALLSPLGQPGVYDLVLAHGVTDPADPTVSIRRLASLVRPAGYISLLERGFEGSELELLHEERFGAAEILHVVGRVTDGGREVAAFPPAELIQILGATGAAAWSWYGVGVQGKPDKRPATEVDPMELKRMVRAEHRAGKDRSLRSAARFLHFIARM